MKPHQICIKNGTIITMEKNCPVIHGGTILIKGTKIIRIDDSDRISANDGKTTVIDAEGSIVMPGLVNCHTHLPMSLFRGLADDLPLDVWLNEHMFPAEATRINPESTREWALHSCRELLLSGTTTCCDGYFHEDQVADAVMESGIRAVLGQGVVDFPAPGVPEPEKNIETALQFAETWKRRSSRIHPSIFCHSPYTCSAETLIKAKQTATRLGLIFQIHVAEAENESAMIPENKMEKISGNGHSILRKKALMSPVQWLEHLGILDKSTLLVHCVWLNEKDIAIIKKRKCAIAHCAESNMKLASGIAPVTDILKAGIPLGLGTDGSASNNNLDMFTEMDMVAKLHKVAKQDPCALKAESVAKMATLGGAKVLGLEKQIGSIATGKKADIIIINTRKPHLIPMHNPFSAIVYSVKGGDVAHVIVDGQQLVKHGKLMHGEKK